VLEQLRDRHTGATFAIIGSGPSGRAYAGREDVAIAVNGGALVDVPFHYFACGDISSPDTQWFHAASAYQVRRLIASFVAPFDAAMYPEPDLRARLQADLRATRGTPPYDYVPLARPVGRHAWFRYAVPHFPHAHATLDRFCAQARVAHGATIAGVALQIAHLMGAASLVLYGCNLDNDDGRNYLHPRASVGRTLPVQRTNMATLVGWLAGHGKPVTVVR